jgi:hypothetical protein
VFEIARAAAATATPTILALFNGRNVADPFGSLIAASAGKPFGTTRQAVYERVTAITH